MALSRAGEIALDYSDAPFVVSDRGERNRLIYNNACGCENQAICAQGSCQCQGFFWGELCQLPDRCQTFEDIQPLCWAQGTKKCRPREHGTAYKSRVKMHDYRNLKMGYFDCQNSRKCVSVDSEMIKTCLELIFSAKTTLQTSIVAVFEP